MNGTNGRLTATKRGRERQASLNVSEPDMYNSDGDEAPVEDSDSPGASTAMPAAGRNVGQPLKKRAKGDSANTYLAQGAAVANFLSQNYLSTFQPSSYGSPSDGSGPSLEILEQPRARGFRFRYPCEGPCHGELRGENSEPRLKTYPTVRLRGVQSRARVLVSLVCHDNPIRPHAHCLVGKNVFAGQCVMEIGKETDWTAQFPRLSILHIPKKNAARVLLERYALLKHSATSPSNGVHGMDDGRVGNGDERQEKAKYDEKMAMDLQLLPGAREQLAGGAAALASLEEEDRRQLEECATEQARTMNLNVVRLCFQAFLPDDETGSFTRHIEPKLSQPVYDTKASSSSALRICRLDKHTGSALGGDVVFMLCDRVQKDDIAIRFFESRTSDSAREDSAEETDYHWEADGEFSVNDVHRQSAIVFKTPPYRQSNITHPVKVWIALKRRSEDEVGVPHPFTYLPADACVCTCKNGISKNSTVISSVPHVTQLTSPIAGHTLTKSMSVPSMLSPPPPPQNDTTMVATSLISSVPPLAIPAAAAAGLTSPVIAAPSNGTYYVYQQVGMPPGAVAMPVPSTMPTSPYTTMPSLGMPFYQPMMAPCNLGNGGATGLMPSHYSMTTVPVKSE